MRSIEANYRKIQSRNPYLGTYPCLCQAVRYKKFSRKSLVKAFNELMPESEYSQDEKKELIDYLENQTNMLEEGEIRAKNAHSKH
ncbi:hypothetical protein COU49_02570 [Candidatus Nomurabacteria bacterium CG10_big_fil_rev_8_21_14_0_10_35_16]|uniref:Uncharacterized protein n=1 Tax=Candidatus Nomurabacteria bacterium CG10_big_fil_rev_8_21_14_0_10_35_16 TaxID=1974731 RepID=A0A2H0TD63_9BACT|nr:MAG: hypothetical protein COU49_02570 [Candidatus Nomurabacteria bacterium CG10_big_fil_rev_8_21_14_0_10_35_16]